MLTNVPTMFPPKTYKLMQALGHFSKEVFTQRKTIYLAPRITYIVFAFHNLVWCMLFEVIITL
jgi:hypothetical protein